jgi:hypothetical protein
VLGGGPGEVHEKGGFDGETAGLPVGPAARGVELPRGVRHGRARSAAARHGPRNSPMSRIFCSFGAVLVAGDGVPGEDELQDAAERAADAEAAARRAGGGSWPTAGRADGRRSPLQAPQDPAAGPLVSVNTSAPLR